MADPAGATGGGSAAAGVADVVIADRADWAVPDHTAAAGSVAAVAHVEPAVGLAAVTRPLDPALAMPVPWRGRCCRPRGPILLSTTPSRHRGVGVRDGRCAGQHSSSADAQSASVSQMEGLLYGCCVRRGPRTPRASLRNGTVRPVRAISRISCPCRPCGQNPPSSYRYRRVSTRRLTSSAWNSGRRPFSCCALRTGWSKRRL